MAIQAVLFDLDNTLTHRDQSILAYSQFLAQTYQHQLQHADISLIQAIIRRIDNGGYPKKEWLTHPSIAASVAYALQQELSWNSLPDFDELTQFWFQQFGLSAVAMQGASQLLTELKQAGYKLAVISNGGHATRLTILQGLGFSHYFHEIVSSELAGLSKPNPEIFLYTCQKLAVEPEHCLFVGDHPVNDVQGAMAAGMQALWLQGFHPATDHQPVHTIQHLAEIKKFL
ncbi:HAD family hydrolase [Acinetobacter bouvetii]|uniref:Phosphoglycolate phosphatase n=1 Tax=Acinetobacter bouvetii TaxID=202951 RepID=A0A811GI47_9GAMM|nr:HAD family hydrolase [Acinetobacter bouvetii]CAB1222819.1 Phosphoglycolate phosphatase [Acinetobacter bouvetii]